MYTLVINSNGEAGGLARWLRERPGSDQDVVEVDRDVVAAQLIRSDAPPCRVVRCGAEGLDVSPLLAVSSECGRPMPPVLVLADREGLRKVAGLTEPSLRATLRPVSKEALYNLLDGMAPVDDADIALSFGPESPLPEKHFGLFVGTSPAMQGVYRTLSKVARSEATCLVTGESGTGKELAAQVLHQLSHRGEGPFVSVNCGAIPENLLESEFFGHKKGAFTGAISEHRGRFLAADGGTLFLDEIGEMQLSLQVKLLRALQTKEVQPVGSSRTVRVDARVVAATNKELEVEMQKGTFREDLYYRLAIIPVRMPALRERREDIPMLVRSLVGEINERTEFPVRGICSSALSALGSYDWPGNVRELGAVLERMVVLSDGDVLSVADLPLHIRAAAGLHEEETVDAFADPCLPEDGLKLSEAMNHYETSLITQALQRTGWNKNQAARLLQMNRTTLVEKLKKKQLLQPDSGALLRVAGN